MNVNNTATAPVQLRLLGEFAIHTAGRRTSGIDDPKARALLAWLALQPHADIPLERLSRSLWPGADRTAADEQLQRCLTKLRHLFALDGIPGLVIEEEAVRLDGTRIGSDALEFERLSRESDVASLEQAISTYRGTFMEGFHTGEPDIDAWLDTERQRLENLYLGILQTLLAAGDETRHHVDSMTLARRILAIDPFDQSAHHAMMLGLVQAGDPDAALQHFEAFRERLWSDRQQEPSPETLALHASIAAGDFDAGGEGNDDPSATDLDHDRNKENAADDDRSTDPADRPASAQARNRMQHPASRRLLLILALIAVALLVYVLATGLEGNDPAEGTVAERPAASAPTEPAVDREYVQPVIAVLPFTGSASADRLEALHDSITDDLIKALSRTSGLTTVGRSRSLALRYQDDPLAAAREYGASHLLRGRTRQQHERLIIDVQLVDTTTGGTVWAEQINGAAEDTFESGSTIARRIADALDVTLIDLWMQADTALYAEKPAVALPLYERVLERNPQFVPGLVGQIASLGHLGRAAEAREPIAALHHLLPAFDLDEHRPPEPRQSPEHRRYLVAGLAAAGLPPRSP